MSMPISILLAILLSLRSHHEGSTQSKHGHEASPCLPLRLQGKRIPHPTTI
ncbi:hypothetical protein M758_7G039600 [Ceratodon purpureus]|uniref:Uncharacterized protein n=1 Tax=Ceratodon purpureus TaxID=3225 RepID=A0A8T0H4H5_CERPU|nr:hypothetical protein KC19_7G042900 [Ceratodon purpureus]KAG0610113.1 hypothetical protein M758_7G039600 [Ceratodon purpureus]